VYSQQCEEGGRVGKAHGEEDDVVSLLN
ncbi:hypothetical protein A2U01_0077099, partial [Trifolium medium]|nr:hypothetical protein [Trifolium medium]